MHKAIHPNFPDYYIREDGVVERRVDSKKYQKAGDILNGRVLMSGYRQYKLVDAGGDRRLIRANRLVCEAFHGPAPTDRHHAAHKNGIRLDNRKDNLYWATPKQNGADKIRHGTQVRGEKMGRSVLTDALVRDIRTEFNGVRGSKAHLARKYGVSVHAVSLALSGDTWSHIDTKPSAPERLWDRLSKEEKHASIALLASHGLSYGQVAEKLETTRDAIAHFAIGARIKFLRVDEKQNYLNSRRVA